MEQAPSARIGSGLENGNQSRSDFSFIELENWESELSVIFDGKHFSRRSRVPNLFRGGETQQCLDFNGAHHSARFFDQLALENHGVSLLLPQSDFVEVIRRHCPNMSRALITRND